MSKENKSRYALLGMLSLAPMSGYDLKKAIETSVGHFWHESYAQIYPMLKQLTSEGLTTSHIEEQEGKPDRSIYTLTDKGHAELQRWLTSPVEHQVLRNELLLKLFFGSQLPPSITTQRMQEYRELQVQLLRIYQQTEANIKEIYSGNPNLPYWLITINNGKHTTEAVIDWCDETLTTLETLSQEIQ